MSPESFDRGALTEAVYYILLVLHSPMHGYAIMQSIERLTAGRVSLGPGTLYGALNALAQKGWIGAVAPAPEGRRKEYVISETGRDAFQGETERIRELLRNAEILEQGMGKGGGRP